MRDLVEELLAHESVVTSDSASRRQIDAIEGYFDAPLPRMLVNLWRASDGVRLERLDAHLLGASEIQQFLADGVWNDELIERGFVPVLDPYTIHMGDGRAFFVKHPDFLSRSPSGRTVIVHQDNETFSVLDLLLMTELEVHAPSNDEAAA